MAAVRAARDALREAPVGAQLIVVMADSGTSRADVRAFARSVGPGPARYVVDDRSGALSSTLGASSLASAVVYDARGRVVARPDARSRQVVAACRRLTGDSPARLRVRRARLPWHPGVNCIRPELESLT